MTLPSRAPIRRAIAEGLETATAGVSTPPAVYPYMRTGFDGESPLVRVWTDSAGRPDSLEQGLNSQFLVTVQVWVMVDERAPATVQEESEDLLDEIEREIATWIEANVSSDLWHSLRYDRNSYIQSAQIGPFAYLIEEIVLSVQATD